MCWPHATRKIEANLKLVFDCDALENKYTKERESSERELDVLKTYEYFRDQWGPNSKVKNWFEHAFPFHVGHNQSMESKNQKIKDSHTFKRRVGIGEFFKICERMLREFGEEDDTLITEGRLAALIKPDFKDGQCKTGLARMAEGWKWSHEFRKGLANKVVRIDSLTPTFYAVAREHNLGEVVQLYGVNKSAHSTKPLKDKILLKLEERSHPSNKSWDEKKKILTDCYFIEERGGDFFGDCFEGIKGRYCEHSIGKH